MNNKRFFTFLVSFLLVFSSIPFNSFNNVQAQTSQEGKNIVFATYGERPALSLDGKTVFVGKGRPDNNEADVYNIGMYNTETGSLIKTITVDNGTQYPVLSPLGKYIALSGYQFLLLDGKTGERLFSLPYTIAQFSFKATDDTLVALAYSTNKSVDKGNKVSIFDTKTNSVIYEKEYTTDKKMRVTLHPTLPIVAVSYGVDVEIINYETNELISKIENPFNYDETLDYLAIFQLSFSDDGKLNMINRYCAEIPFLQYESDPDQNYKRSSLSLNAYVNETVKNRDTSPNEISYGKNKEIILHYDRKIKFFDSTSGAYLKSIDSNIDEVVFSNNFDKIAYTKNYGYNTGTMPKYIEVQDYPIQTNQVNTIEFKDTAIFLREDSSTYYSLEYINDVGEKVLLDPSEIKLETLDENVATIDDTNKIVANKRGTTIIKATYNGLTDYLSVEVAKKTGWPIEPLYDSSTMIKGYGYPLDVLKIYVGNRQYTAKVNIYGEFSVKLDQPLKANTFVHFMLTAPSDYSYEFVIRDTVAPKQPSITKADATASVVEGTTEPNATITITADQLSSSSSTLSSRSISSGTGITTFTTKADMNGKFSLSVKGMSGVGYFDATAIDLVGNRSKSTKSKVVDTKAPDAPHVNLFSNNSTSINGLTEPNVKVHVRKNGILIGNATASKTGSFSVKVPKQNTGTILTVTATDYSYNISKVTSVKTLKAPILPTVNNVTYKSKTVTGKAQPYTTITVNNGSKVLGNSKANSKGIFSVKITPQKKGIKLTVYSKNSQGLVSLPKAVLVK